jgi:ketosteroid isomerase-like protein
MSTLELAKKFVSLCQQHKDSEALLTMFDKDAVSIEAAAMPGMPQEMRGIPAIQEKGKWWTENHEVHSVTVDGPYPHGDRFAVRFGYDITRKATKERIRMDEVALYTVHDGKIVREEFFYVT